MQPKWLERAIETHQFHRSKCLASDEWNIQKTAKALRRSMGSISEDLMIAKALKTHEAKLEKYKYAYEALEFIREELRKESLEKIE